MKNLNIKRVCCAVILKENKVLIAKRSDEKFTGLWEFPGGKVNNGESGEYLKTDAWKRKRYGFAICFMFFC